MSRWFCRTAVFGIALFVAAGCGTTRYVMDAGEGLAFLSEIDDSDSVSPPVETTRGSSSSDTSAKGESGDAAAGTISVPDVVGMTRTQARALLKETGLRLYKTRGKAGGYDMGDSPIVAQKPSAGETIESGGRVYATYPPAPMLPVPDLVGMTGNDARTALRSAKFSTRYVKKTDQRVATQTPEAGSLAPAGSSVKVTLE